MTLEQCRKNTALLGFSDTLTELDDTAENAFLAALNRAIWEVSSIRPRTGVITLYHGMPTNLAARTHWLHRPGTEDTVCCMGDAYAFSVTGSGTCTVSNGIESHIYTWQRETTPKIFRGRLSGVLELTFSGSEFFTVSGLGVYEAYQDPDAEIPLWDPVTVYDLTKCAGDFMKVHCPPEREAAGKYVPLTEGYGIENGHELVLPTGESGFYRILYEKTPTQLDKDADYDNVIDLDEDLCQLLPLQIAYYLMLDTDATMAEGYLRLYKEGAYRIMQGEKQKGNVRWETTNHW